MLIGPGGNSCGPGQKGTNAPCSQFARQIEMWKRRLMRIWKMEKGNCIFLLPGAAICGLLLLLFQRLRLRSGVGQARLSPNRNGCIQPWRTWPRGKGLECISLNGRSGKKIIIDKYKWGQAGSGKLKVEHFYNSYAKSRNYSKTTRKVHREMKKIRGPFKSSIIGH